MKNTANKLVILALCASSMLSFGCVRTDQPMREWCAKKTIDTVPKKGYGYYARQLKSKYPQLKNLDWRDISEYIKEEFNDGKMLMENSTITLPMYEIADKCQ